MKYAAYTSDELWELCLAKDHVAFKLLFEREFDSLLAYGQKVSNNQADTKDAIQELFTDLWARKSSRSIQNIKFYLLKALKYKLINWL